MSYKSNLTAVMFALHEAKHEFCVGTGVLTVAEVQSVTPVKTGNLKKCIASEVMSDNAGIYIGVTPEAPYGLFVDQGSSRQPAQHFLENGSNNAIPKIINVANQVYKRLG